VGNTATPADPKELVLEFLQSGAVGDDSLVGGVTSALRIWRAETARMGGKACNSVAFKAQTLKQ